MQDPINMSNLEVGEENGEMQTAFPAPQNEGKLKFRAPFTLLILSLSAGLLYNFLFVGNHPGISIPIYFLFLLGIGIFFARQEGYQLIRPSIWLVVAILFFSIMSFVRAETFTRVMDTLLAAGFLVLLVVSYRGARWWSFSLVQFISRMFSLAIAACSSIFRIDLQLSRKTDEGQQRRRSGWAILRGLLIATPIVLFFTVLLASADPLFGGHISKLVEWISFEKLPELIMRFIIICVVTTFSAGFLDYAVRKSTADTPRKPGKQWLGFIESTVVLGAINLLFFIFVLYQFPYFFGGEANIHIDGYTYAEYARKGFGELIAVAVFSILFYLVLSRLAKRQNEGQKRFFSIMGLVLFLLVTVILISAFRRLSLYIDAYGLTSLRIYSHVFMIWLAVLLAALVVMEFTDKLDYTTLALVVFSAGYIVTLNLLNVDAFIARYNVKDAKAQGGRMALDVAYLSELSSDAFPVLVDRYKEADQVNDPMTDQLAANLVCNAFNHDDFINEYNWTAFNVSQFRAQKLWEKAQAENILPDYRLETSEYPVRFYLNNVYYDCRTFYDWD